MRDSDDRFLESWKCPRCGRVNTISVPRELQDADRIPVTCAGCGTEHDLHEVLANTKKP